MRHAGGTGASSSLASRCRRHGIVRVSSCALEVFFSGSGALSLAHPFWRRLTFTLSALCSFLRTTVIGIDRVSEVHAERKKGGRELPVSVKSVGARTNRIGKGVRDHHRVSAFRAI